MTEQQQRSAAQDFADYWKGRGYEKGESQPFWLSLLRDVFGVEHPEQFISFENQGHLDHTSFIDGFIPSTRVMIEQKSRGKNLNAPIKQSDGSLLTPFLQAKRYILDLPVSQHPLWVVTSNFEEIWIYDMERPGGEPEKIRICDLPKEYYRLSFLVETDNSHLQHEMEVSFKAGELVGKLYDALLPQYHNPESAATLHSLNVLCVRLVFCLYAEDAGLFSKHDAFHDYLALFDASHTRKALNELFRVLNQEIEERDPYLEPELAAFPYVNGGLFADMDVEIPNFTNEIRDLLLNKASLDFDWSEISPTIFGAVFESTLNPETRRKGGMHYMSIENIHKVIDPLFLDGLKSELNEIIGKRENEATERRDLATPQSRSLSASSESKAARLKAFQTKLSTLTFLDPTCGSGNFLTESYICLRRLENEVLHQLCQGQMLLGVGDFIKVGIGQFYGIEINDFAVTVAKTALWIAESQMMKQTEDIVMTDIDFFPLKSNANIVHGNSLHIDWETLCPKDKLCYIMGNPPFVGYSFQTKEQKDDLTMVMPNFGKILDYVCAWYLKSAQMMQGTEIHTALVSTNSITQGEQVAVLWKPLMEHYGVKIDFAYRTFRWNSEATLKAHVHCVIIGFSCCESKTQKVIFNESGRATVVKRINPYLIDYDNIFIEDRKTPICEGVSIINKGSQGTDDGAFYFTLEEYLNIIDKYPDAAIFLKEATNGQTFINKQKRYCLWCKDLPIMELKKYPELLERLKQVKAFRSASSKEASRKWADYPYLFTEGRQPTNGYYLLLPLTSSEHRKYVPIGFLSCDITANNSVQMIPNATLYEFGILNSNVFMAWMRTVGGRLKSDYRITVTNVYNNFPWCNPTAEQKQKIGQTALAILDDRAKYPDNSLADLYDEFTMPPEPRRAHQDNDRAVMEAYGFSTKMAESECVAELMQLYGEMVGNQKM